MTPPYKVTLVDLTPDAKAVAPAADKVELGLMTAEEIYQLAGNLLRLDIGANPHAEPGILVQRGEKGWRIAAYAGRLRMYKSTSLFDEFWTVETPLALAQLPPFANQPAGHTSSRSTRSHPAQMKRYQAARSVAEVAGLFLLGVILIVIGFWYGLPQRKLSDLPPDVVVVTSDSERTSVFSAVAGNYVAGKPKQGESIVTITPDGRVSLATIGQDGKPDAPRLQEQARAGRKGPLAVIITSFGPIAELPPDAVNVGNGQWRRLNPN